MNFDQWKKLSEPSRKRIAQKLDFWKHEGRDIAAAVLKAFVRHYGSNNNIEIADKIIRLRDNAGWAIGVQCFNGAGLKITPRNYMGIRVSRLYIDHINDAVFSQFMPKKICKSHFLPLSCSYKGANSRLSRKKASSHRFFTPF